jgi:carbamoyl-phosphate synthase small subunit
VQYHPEAAAGPHDADYLFDRFIELMASGRAHRPPGTDDGSAPATAPRSAEESDAASN